MSKMKKIFMGSMILMISLILVGCRSYAKIEGTTEEVKTGVSIQKAGTRNSEYLNTLTVVDLEEQDGNTAIVERPISINDNMSLGDSLPKYEEDYFYFNWDGTVSYLEEYDFTPDVNREEQKRVYYNVNDFADITDFAVYISYLRYNVIDKDTEEIETYFQGDALLDNNNGAKLILPDQKYDYSNDGKSVNLELKTTDLLGVNTGDTVEVLGIQLYIARKDSLMEFNQEGNDKYSYSYRLESDIEEKLEEAKARTNGGEDTLFHKPTGTWANHGGIATLRDTYLRTNGVYYEISLKEKEGYYVFSEYTVNNSYYDELKNGKTTMYVKEGITYESSRLHPVNVLEYEFNHFDWIGEGNFIIATPEDYEVKEKGKFTKDFVIFNGSEYLPYEARGKNPEVLNEKYTGAFTVYYSNLAIIGNDVTYLRQANIESENSGIPEIGINKDSQNRYFYHFPVQVNTLGLYTQGDYFDYLDKNYNGEDGYKLDGDRSFLGNREFYGIGQSHSTKSTLIVTGGSSNEDINSPGMFSNRVSSSINDIRFTDNVSHIFNIDPVNNIFQKVVNGKYVNITYSDYINAYDLDTVKKVFGDDVNPEDPVIIDMSYSMNWYMQGNILLPITGNIKNIYEFSTYDYYNPTKNLGDIVKSAKTIHSDIESFYGLYDRGEEFEVMGNVFVEIFREKSIRYNMMSEALLTTEFRIANGYVYDSNGKGYNQVFLDTNHTISDQSRGYFLNGMYTLHYFRTRSSYDKVNIVHDFSLRLNPGLKNDKDGEARHILRTRGYLDFIN